jgi:hypothetical protein
MSECKKCYSDKNRVTPLLKPRNCLENHLQYICGTCGRCICIDKDEKRNVRRWNFPFKSPEIARLYLRTADFTMKKPCGIYEIISSKGRKFYKIFAGISDLEEYLAGNRGRKCKSMSPVYIRSEYEDFPGTEVRRLSWEEVEKYLSEQEQQYRTLK